jgi:type IV pilus assembly protein PilA
MFLQNLRAKIGARLNGDGEAGFTLIELLVVMLILGILAAIALPAFFNQKEKATDAKAKETAHTVQVALESCSTDNNGTYPVAAACSYTNLRSTYETTLPETGVTVTAPAGDAYDIAVTSTSSTPRTFHITRASGGAVTYPCSPVGGGCPTGGWGG